jgi:hypothetical protein
MYSTLDFEGLSYMLDPTILKRDTSISLYGSESLIFYNPDIYSTQQSRSQSYQTSNSGQQ